MLKISQFGINSNEATPGHKSEYNYCKIFELSISDWIDLVLSRVWTLKLFFICKKKDDIKGVKVDQNILEEEYRKIE